MSQRLVDRLLADLKQEYDGYAGELLAGNVSKDAYPGFIGRIMGLTIAMDQVRTTWEAWTGDDESEG